MVFVLMLFVYSSIIMYLPNGFFQFTKDLTSQVRESDGRNVDRKMKFSLEGLIIKWARQVGNSSFTNLH